jgi:type IV pilus assembly protein PilE
VSQCGRDVPRPFQHAREERYFATNNRYSVTAGDLGYTALPASVGSNYYQLSVQCTVANAVCTDFTLTATAINSQVKDTACATLTLNSTGVQNATGSTTAATTCWN